MAEFSIEDDTLVYRDVNVAYQETFGYDRERLVGESVADVQAGEVEPVETALAGESAERKISRQTVTGQRDFQLTVTPFEGGGTPGAYAWYVDSTESEDLAAGYRDKANLFDQLLEQLPAALYVKDREARHLYMSDYDIPPEEVLGKTDLEVYPDEGFADEAYADDMHVIETGEPIINKEEYNDDNGEWTITSKVPWRDDGSVKGLIGVTRIITEKKEYEREIQLKNERLEKFASVLSHDLRNPLNVAFGHLDLVQQEYDSKHLDRIGTSLERIDALIHDILELARKGQAALEPETVELSSIAERAWRNTQTGEISLEIDADLEIRADEARVIELFENLFVNAHKHADAETITVGVLSDEAGFYVSDDGGGIPPEDHEEIFWPGFTTDEDGTGFGLAIVSEIVENHNWEIDVTESEWGGARFEITDVKFA